MVLNGWESDCSLNFLSIGDIRFSSQLYRIGKLTARNNTSKQIFDIDHMYEEVIISCAIDLYLLLIYTEVFSLSSLCNTRNMTILRLSIAKCSCQVFFFQVQHVFVYSCIIYPVDKLNRCVTSWKRRSNVISQDFTPQNGPPTDEPTMASKIGQERILVYSKMCCCDGSVSRKTPAVENFLLIHGLKRLHVHEPQLVSFNMCHSLAY